MDSRITHPARKSSREWQEDMIWRLYEREGLSAGVSDLLRHVDIGTRRALLVKMGEDNES